MKRNEGLYTSKTDLWATPKKIFDELNNEFLVIVYILLPAMPFQ